MLMMFTVLTGLPSVLLLANISMHRTLTDSDGMTPRQGSYLLGGLVLIASLTSVCFVRKFGRRTLFLLGFGSVSVLHLAIGGFVSVTFDQGIMMYVCVFLVVYMISLGPISWMYAAETQPDIGLGVSTAVFMLFSLLISTFKDIFI